MIFEEAKEKLKGLAVILLTPWDRNFDVDEEGLRENVRFIVDGGVVEGKGSLFATCGCGEGPFMDVEEIRSVTEIILDEVKVRVPVFLGSFYRDIKTNVRLLKIAEDIGALGAQIVPPYYGSPTLDEIFRFCEKLNDSTDLGIVLYNNYYSTGRDMPSEFLERLTKLDRIVALKWFSANPVNEINAIARFKDRFNFFSNNLGTFIQGAMAGAKGIVSVMANIAPRYELQFWDLVQRGEYGRAHDHMMKLSIPFYQFSGDQVASGVGIASQWKAALEICGRPSGGLRPPQTPLSGEQKAKMAEILSKAGVIK